LDSLFREHGLKRIHYLSVDVEGSELQVLQSIDFNEVYIDVIGFENNYENTTIETIAFLKQHDYKELQSVGEDFFMIRTNSPFAPKKFSLLRR
jgi:flagellar basal body rod protein FlgG